MSSIPLLPTKSVWTLQQQELSMGYQETTVVCCLKYIQTKAKPSLKESLNRVKTKTEQNQESRKFTFSK